LIKTHPSPLSKNQRPDIWPGYCPDRNPPIAL
jgi:hypothetical protein